MDSSNRNTALASALAEELARCGVERAVIVNPSTYGNQNGPTLDAIAASGGRFRGVAVLTPDVTEKEIARLHDGGMRGLRVTTLTGGGTRAEHLATLADKVKDLGWVMQVHLHNIDDLDAVAPLLETLPIRYLIDHFGRARGGQAPRLERARGRDHAQRLDVVVDLGVDGGVVAGGAGRDPAAERGELPGLEEEPERQARGLELRFERGAEHARLHARGLGSGVDLEHAVEVLRAVDHHRDVHALAVLRRAAAARENKAAKDELTGSTITITSLGVLGGLVTTPVINHPEVAIIGPNAILERPVVRGGQIVVRPAREAGFVAERNVIAGNVIGYGATRGSMFIRGIVGERFLVRNSGATAVVEGVGGHALEYMTGGDSAIVAIQYSYLPSWISYLVDQSTAGEAGRALFDAVYGPDIVSNGVAGDSTTVPSAVVVALFAFLGTGVVAKYGFHPDGERS